jgi:multiple sugar transport system substrate-binding protein
MYQRLKSTRWVQIPAMMALVGLVMSACSGDDAGNGATAGTDGDSAGAEVDGEFDWRRYEGETIRIALNQHPWQQAIEPRIAEFEELTGITVVAEALPEEQFRQRVQVELTARSNDIDVFMTSSLQEGGRFHQAGWYEDLYPYVQNESITSSDYDFDDFADGTIDGLDLDGNLIAVPIQVETNMLYYRKDIFDDHGVEVPTTLDDLEAVASQIDDPNGTRAFTSRGRLAAAVTMMAPFLYAHGVNWTDDQGMAAFNGPEGMAAFDFYGRLLREHGPSGVVNSSWEENVSLFQQGEVAMFVDASVFMSNVLDPEQSTVADNVGFAAIPSGPGGDGQTFWAWSLAMSSASESKEAAWYFIQWATSPEVVQAAQDEGVTGARESGTFGDFYPDEWVEVFEAQLPVGRRTTPDVVPIPEVRDAIGQAIVTAIEGGDVETAVQRAAEEFDRIIEAEG